METLNKLNEQLSKLNDIEFFSRREKLESEKEVLISFLEKSSTSLQRKINERLLEVENQLQKL